VKHSRFSALPGWFSTGTTVPDMTLLELIEEFNLPFTESTLCRRLIKRGLTFKKRHSTQMGENEKM